MGKNFFERVEFNTRVIESKNFVVVPTLGAMIEGWMLIVPRDFHLNLAQLKPHLFDELDSVIQQTELIIRKKFHTPTVLFEHGPTAIGSTAGCSVDYAHLHVVPTEFDLLGGLRRFLGLEYDWQAVQNLMALSHRRVECNDYLYFRNQSGNHFLTLQKDIPSQLFRKVIANYLGKPNSYDWKQFPEMKKIRNTIEKIQDVDLIDE
jgi:ATP adenylyltransferase